MSVAAPTTVRDLAERDSTLRQIARVSWAICRRGLLRAVRIPSIIVPMTAMPIFFVVAFTGSFNGLTDVSGYGTDNIYNWMTPYAIAQGASFAGAGAGAAIATDLENGFFDRLLLGPGSRLPIVLGPVLYSMIRALVPTTLVLVVAAVLGGLDLPGGVLGVVMLYGAAVGLATTIALLTANLALWLKSVRTMMLGQLFIFAFTFLSIGQVPLAFLTGWMKPAAEINPMTQILELARQGFLGEVTWGLTWPGLVAIIVMSGALAALAVAQLRRAAP